MEIGSKVFLMRFSGTNRCKLVNMVDYVPITYFHLVEAQTLTEAEFLDEIQTKFKSFPPCFSQSPLQLCLEISVSSNSRNLLQFLDLEFSYCTLSRRKEENLIESQTLYPIV
jgi:hypothetical protein